MVLSRAGCLGCQVCLIVNVPGSKNAAVESRRLLLPIPGHALTIGDQEDGREAHR